MDLKLDHSRDDKITPFGKETLKDRYLLKNESYQGLFARVAAAFSDNPEHAQRMYDYISQMWFMPATPPLSNGGTDRGLPISCYLNKVEDSLEDIFAKWDENGWLGAGGGGIGTCWSALRSIGEPVRGRGHSSGIIPFIRMSDSQTLAVSQGSLRRGAAAVYLDISHPEIEEFIELRSPTGDYNRKALNLHHGVVIPDKFMEAVRDGEGWELIDPVSGAIKANLDARELFQRLLDTRMKTGEPYLLFSDTVNRSLVEHHKMQGLKVTQSNLCSEIMLHTGKDVHGKDRTAVCCLGSVNLELWEEWRENDLFVEDCLRFLDNVLQDFINKTEGKKGFENARYSASQERSVGLGVMGLHSLFQSLGLPFECAMAKALNKSIFEWIRSKADAANVKLAQEKGACPDAELYGVEKRFSHMLAIAPTASISIIGGTSPCVEPWNNNCFTQKTLSGSFRVANKHLEAALEQYGLNSEAIWESILEHEGSVQHLAALPQEVRDVFKTAFEIDQRWIVEMAADRSEAIDQGQSINLFLPGQIHKFDLMMLHYTAWEKGVKSLYYCRSMSIQRAQYAGGVDKDNTIARDKVLMKTERTDYAECLACQ